RAVRVAAAYALAKLGPLAWQAIPGLRQALLDEDREVRLGAIYALPAMGPQAASALPELKGLLLDEDREVRQQAFESIKRIGIAVKHHKAPARRDANAQAGQ